MTVPLHYAKHEAALPNGYYKYNWVASTRRQSPVAASGLITLPSGSCGNTMMFGETGKSCSRVPNE